VRRLAPRPLAAALPGAIRGAEPGTLLARVQTIWPGVAGAALAAGARPIAEREAIVTVGCESAVWANELELLGSELTAQLNASLEPSGAGRIERLRFVVVG
jgi:predicted nucleic acid-binding Zn ribbon protein